MINIEFTNFFSFVQKICKIKLVGILGKISLEKYFIEEKIIA